MSRPRTPASCARCERTDVRLATTWPEGRICRRCYQRATRIHGTCPACNIHRLLPGLLSGEPACRDCAGIPKDFHCSRCGRELPLEHPTFTEHPTPRRVAFLRELCIEHGLLPPVHLDIERFQSWLADKTALAHPDAGRLITQYGRWVHLNRMHHLAETGQLKKGTVLSAKQSTTVALGFLAYLREHETSPADCRQADIDSWLTGGPTTRSLARGFIRWAMQHAHMPSVEIPYRLAKTTPIISQEQRLGHIERLLESNTALRPLERTAALLLLLYGQPLARIARMRLDQLDSGDDGGVTIRFASDHLRIPEPFEAVVRAHLEDLPNLNTSAHRDNGWFFPGARPGQNIHQSTLMNLLREAGIDLRGAKNAALRELVLQMPAPIVADSFNYSYTVTEQHRRNAGAQFIDYLTKRL